MSKLLFFFLSILCLYSIAQNNTEEHQHSNPDKEFHSHNEHHDLRVGLVVAHTYIPTNTIRGQETFIVPTIGLDIEYWVNHKWGIGLHNDLELEVFEVETDQGGIFIEKRFPILFTLDVLYKPYKGLVLLAGPGYEIEPNQNLYVFRAGIEYEVELNEVWDFAPVIVYDYRHNAFDTYSYGIGIGMRF